MIVQKTEMVTFVTSKQYIKLYCRSFEDEEDASGASLGGSNDACSSAVGDG